MGSTILFGGHYRVEVANGKAGEVRPFTRSCLSLDLKGDKAPEALMVTHLLDRSQHGKIRLLVPGGPQARLCNDVREPKWWAVEGTRVRLLPQDEKK